MQNIPLDQERLLITSTGPDGVQAAQDWQPGADGQRRAVGQAVGKDGRPLWTVDVMIPPQHGNRAEVMRLEVTGDRPDVGDYGDVLQLDRPELRTWINKKTASMGQALNCQAVKVAGAIRPRPPSPDAP